MLVRENRFPVGVRRDETGRPRGVPACCAHQRHASCLELTLRFPYVWESGQVPGAVVPAGIKGQHVFIEDTVEKADRVVAVLQAMNLQVSAIMGSSPGLGGVENMGEAAPGTWNPCYSVTGFRFLV